MFKNNLNPLTRNDESIFQSICRVLFNRAQQKKERYNRIMPVGEYVSDRWEKSEYLGFGKGSSVYDSAYIYGDVMAGENVWIGPFTILDGSAGTLQIGANTQISAGCQIYTHDSSSKKNPRSGSVIIGENVYLGPNVIVSCGVTIGDNVIIGSNSFVNKDIPKNVKAYGNPVQIAKVDEE